LAAGAAPLALTGFAGAADGVGCVSFGVSANAGADTINNDNTVPANFLIASLF
jgi:hypothetical protein